MKVGEEEWSVHRRYAEFREFHSQVRDLGVLELHLCDFISLYGVGGSSLSGSSQKWVFLSFLQKEHLVAR